MSALPRLYLDTNATAPLKEAARNALDELLREGIANPSSIHHHGQKAKKYISRAREDISASLGCKDPEQILFTSSGTEANQTVIQSQLGAFFQAGMKVQWITSKTEHDSIIQMADWVRQNGGEVLFCDLDSNGVPRPDSLNDLITPDTRLVSLMWVNNETGAISPVEEYSHICSAKKVPLHVDAAQAWGKLPISISSLNIPFSTFSSHKIGALAGTGFIVVQPGSKIKPLIFGKQEKSRRGGTENVLGIAATGAAAKTIDVSSYSLLSAQRDQLEALILSELSGVTINSKTGHRVAGVSNLTFDDIDGESLVMALDLNGLSVSAGSACSSGVIAPSHVLLAMGRTQKQALASLRLSWQTPWSDLEIQRVASTITATIRRFRERNSSLSFESNARA